MDVDTMETTRQEIIDFYSEKYLVQVAMIEWGGSFVQALGVALSKADMQNTAKIKATWGDYWNEYLNKHVQYVQEHYSTL